MTDAEQREAARQFANKWMHGGNENQDGRNFWIELLQDVMGVEKPTEYINFEKQVQLIEEDGKQHTRRIDEYIPAVRVLIEMKGSEHPLDVPEPQSGGAMLTPVAQAIRYNNALPFDEKARWIVACNFTNIWIYDMNKPMPEKDPTKIETVELQQKYPVLSFLVNEHTTELSHEMEVSIDAGNLVGKIYDAFYKQYNIPEPEKGESPEAREKREKKLRSLNALCVRLVFCLYAEDTDIFGKRSVFHDYLKPIEVKDCRVALKRLFTVLDQTEAERDEYLEPELAQFPYVNGGLFADEIEIPPFTEEIKELILTEASSDFDWHDISPTIFGAVFESTLNPETRRSGGMHYTSIENIHKVIDPLFLDDLKREFSDICAIPQQKKKDDALDAFQEKIASLKFLDPACGSGNFLTETYLSLRRLENEALKEKNKGQVAMVFEEQGVNPIKVSIQQFYGIEINDFAATVAKTALWIAESQMLEETKAILVGFNEDFLPLKTYVNIVEGNALRIDWNDVIPASEVNYIMGNPPFVGSSFCTKEQKMDVVNLVGKIKLSNSLDYVSGWYYKAVEYIQNTKIRCAFVSTNSISQGEQVAPMWGNLFDKYDLQINFAYRTFIWNSEANAKAHVHCVIVGFSCSDRNIPRYIYDDSNRIPVDKINGYLVNGPIVSIISRSKPLCDVPKMTKGNQPTDDGNFILSQEEQDLLLENDSSIACCVHRYIGAKDFLNKSEVRYCLWLKGISPSVYRQNKEILRRLDAVREFRSHSTAEPTRKAADKPYMFFSTPQTDENYLIIPRVSSERRRYIPVGFMTPDIIAADSCSIICGATLFHFGILTSNVHMAWMRTVCGRLKSDYRYSGSLVYNNFPWPSPTPEQKQKIEQTAQGILDARTLYPDSSLADLYDPLTMPSELRKAHTGNDIAVMSAYGFSTKMTEADCVAELMKLYQQFVAEKS